LYESKWDEAIADARHKLSEGKVYLARFRAAIKFFEKNKVSGVPWPRSKSRSKEPR